MVVVSLMAILAALALPSFNSLIEKYRVEGVASALVASITLARSEAVRRGATVTVRQRDGCTGNADWSCGWETVIGSGASAETLRQQDPDTRIKVEKSAGGSLSFDALGNSASTAVASFKFSPADTQGSSNLAAVCLARSGRTKLVKGSGSC